MTEPKVVHVSEKVLGQKQRLLSDEDPVRPKPPTPEVTRECIEYQKKRASKEAPGQSKLPKFTPRLVIDKKNYLEGEFTGE